MSKNCRFNRTYVRKNKTYTLSFKELTKMQADIICNIFRSIHHVGVIFEYSAGFTTPRYELRCSVPLYPVNDSFIIPASDLSVICAAFGNVEIPCKNYVLSSSGTPINHLKPFGYEY